VLLIVSVLLECIFGLLEASNSRSCAKTITVCFTALKRTPPELNRTENLRAIPPGDPDFERFPRRNAAEPFNRQLDDHDVARRAHSIGHDRQNLNSSASRSPSTRLRATPQAAADHFLAA